MNFFDGFIKIAAISLVAAILGFNLKCVKNEYSILIAVAACIIIFFSCVAKLESVILSVKRIIDYIDADSSYISIIFKIIGISYISELSSDICKDCGFATLANQVQIFGKITVLAISMPVLLAIVDYVQVLLTT